MELKFNQQTFELLRKAKASYEYNRKHDYGSYSETAATEFSFGYYLGLQDMLKNLQSEGK